MEIAIGVLVYLVVLYAFSTMGRFLKECDDQMLKQMSILKEKE